VANGPLKDRLTKRRLFGLDRSGPPPKRTRKGEPLRPWTIPNAIGYTRLTLIPVFILIAFNSRHGQNALSVALFAVIAWSDYLDGFTARLTGQFSRLGALLDPICDRLLVVSGMAVAWHFHLLPHWLLAVAIAREFVVAFMTRYALYRGIDFKINWLGRLAVAPTMSAPFFAMAGDHAIALGMLYVGVALGVSATVLYFRTGRVDLEQLSSST
jgi:CDP-diacylglycerol--glycerol-3-phosphate 3-phosphatidyltransferase